MTGTTLNRVFYARPTTLVARDLLGKLLTHIPPDGIARTGRIVETEAYMGPDDAASHARAGNKGRASLMFGPAGYAYVYLIYGVHNCFNVVCEEPGYPGAVLIRAVEPTLGLEGQRTSGPGLVCRALEITRDQNGLDLTTSADLFISHAPEIPDGQVRMGPRVGIEFAGDWVSRPWRFWDGASYHVSRNRGGDPFDASVLAVSR